MTEFFFNVLIPPIPPDATTPQIVFDRLMADGMNRKPLNFRAGEWFSGSAQFTSDDFRNTIQPKLKELAQGLPVVYVDLREESHCLVRLKDKFPYEPISWFAINDLANVNIPERSLVIMENIKVAQLEKSLEFALYENTGYNILPIDQVVSEQRLIESTSPHAYVRLHCTDHCCPSMHAVNELYKLVIDMDKWFHFHCHAGKGRTTTFMALTDIIRNCRQNSLEVILQRSKELSNYDLTHIGSDWRKPYMQNRLDMIRAFYLFCCENT